MSQKHPKPFRQLKRELQKIRRLHDATIYAYEQTSDFIRKKLKDREIFSDTTITASLENEERLLARSPHEILPKLSNVYPEVMRESLIVRAVSQFEVFIVDTVWEIANRSIEPFKQGDKVLEYPQAKILSFKSIEEIQNEIITAECRQLTSQGFNYSRKYYEKRFGIYFSKCSVDIAEIEELHERRHIIVHRGGKIDSQYKKRFSPQMEAGAQLITTDKYFQNAINNLTALGEFIINCVDENWALTHQQILENISYLDAKEPTLLKNDIAEFLVKYTAEKQRKEFEEPLAYWFKAKFKDKTDMEAHLRPSYTFSKDGDIHTLSEIFLYSSVLSENEVEWIVEGEKDVTGLYIANQMSFSRHGRFVEFDAKKLVIDG